MRVVSISMVALTCAHALKLAASNAKVGQASRTVHPKSIFTPLRPTLGRPRSCGTAEVTATTGGFPVLFECAAHSNSSRRPCPVAPDPVGAVDCRPRPHAERPAARRPAGPRKDSALRVHHAGESQLRSLLRHLSRRRRHTSRRLRPRLVRRRLRRPLPRRPASQPGRSPQLGQRAELDRRWADGRLHRRIHPEAGRCHGMARRSRAFQLLELRPPLCSSGPPL